MYMHYSVSYIVRIKYELIKYKISTNATISGISYTYYFRLFEYKAKHTKLKQCSYVY